MKIRFIVCLVISIVGNNTLALTQSIPPIEILFFVDKSASVSYNSPDIKGKTEKILWDGVNKVGNPNDELQLLVIHDKTKGAPPVKNYSIPIFSCRPGTPPMQVRKLQNAYKSNIGKEKKVFYDRANQLFKEGYDPDNKQGTDIIGILEVVSRQAANNKKKEIFLFTDAKQSSKNFLVNPKNRQEAINLAIEHARRINKELFIDRNVLANSKVHIVLPYVGSNTKHDNNLTYYWEKLLSQFGMIVDFV
ncbi:hypothetical protein [Segetibacter aerophilus]|uniref:VWFA domain-containing protein n=1 Tax=Segetibacter aerophilus TaxID=670293 RepID=A0A512BIK0_9BACT|nr:hypothetical protein [Segetibacter aerophilus]GEO11796.1 hypothetical protein SAE01_42920 [Segetibacter aerophilus]